MSRLRAERIFSRSLFSSLRSRQSCHMSKKDFLTAFTIQNITATSGFPTASFFSLAPLTIDLAERKFTQEPSAALIRLTVPVVNVVQQNLLIMRIIPDPG